MTKISTARLLVPLLLIAPPSQAQGPSTFVDRTDSGIVAVGDMGARCDGSTDDTAAFNASFTAALAKPNGGVIVIPAGRCLVSSTLALTISGNTSIRLRGEGRDVSEIVWAGNMDGLRVTLSGSSFSWPRTPADAAPVFHADGLSLVSKGPGIGGTALTLTSTAAAGSNIGFAPRVKLYDIGVHGTVNGPQGWHDGVAVNNLPSGLTWDDGYMVFANELPPWNRVGTGIAIRGGVEDADGCVSLVSSLYFLSNITIQNARHGIDIGAGVQDVDMDRVGGNANWFVWASQRAACGQTASIRIANSNQSGFNGSVHIENIDTVFLTNNEPQAFQSPDTGYGPYKAFDFVGSIGGNGSPGSVIITGNKILGNAAHGGKTWVGISIDKVFDVTGGFNPTVISGNLFSLMDVPVQLLAQARNTLLIGNNLNNWLGRVPYLFTQDSNYAAMNVLNGMLEDSNSPATPSSAHGGMTFDGPVALPNITGSDPHAIGQLYFDSNGFVRRSGG